MVAALAREAARPKPMHFQWPQPRPKKEWAKASEEERGLWFETLLIDHPDVKAVVEDACYKLSRVFRIRASDAMLILGESGSGKTTLYYQLAEQVNALYGRDDPERTIVPALKHEVPALCSPSGYCVALLKALGDPNPEGRKKSSLLDDTAALINACEVRVILLDNAQDIPSKRGARGVEQVSVRIRDLIDRTQCLWLFFGTARATEVVDNESQLIKRIPYRALLHYFTLADLANARRFKRLLERMDEWLPLAERNTELLSKLSGLIFIACGGVLDRLVKLLDHVWHSAFEDSREHLVEADFLKGFRRLYGPKIQNPFTKEFQIRHLNGKNEPFEHLHEGKKPKNGAKAVRAPRKKPGEDAA
jgi:energy-coupling factor transporter ATP-binding protein EcfA2